MTRNLVRLTALAAGMLLAGVAACDNPTTTKSASVRLYGLWGKTDETIPPIFLDVRHEAGGDVGQVWLSGVTYTLPATVGDSTVRIARPESSQRPALYGVLRADGRLHVQLNGEPPFDAVLDKGVLVNSPTSRP